MSSLTSDLNASPRPRVLLSLSTERADRVRFIEDLAGTVKRIGGMHQVDPNDWDAIITDSRPSRHVLTTSFERFSRDVPPGLNVIYLHTGEGSEVNPLFDYFEDDAGIGLQLSRTRGVPGNRAVLGEGLPEDLQSLVVRNLVPVIAQREDQWGHLISLRRQAEDLPHDMYRPFLVGPQEMVYAASYRRGPQSLAWVIPTDLPDLRPWFEIAFREWHEDDPERFPAAPGWMESADWYTRVEAEAAAAIDAEVARFAPLLVEHQATMNELNETLAALKVSTAAGERLLLGGQGDALQAEVHSALTEIGFAVQDMDAKWDPRERREDFRITDPDDPTWMVIADATGTTKGVKGTKLMILGRFVAKYLAETPGAAVVPGQWLLANHFIERDPNARPHNMLRSDELAAFRESDGLVIDTAALFVVLQAVRELPSVAPLLRQHLRAMRGEFGLRDARSWVEELHSTE